MSPLDIIRAWKDEEYRLSLTDEERALVPAHPAGLIKLEHTELGQAAGGNKFNPISIGHTFCVDKTCYKLTCDIQTKNACPVTWPTRCPLGTVGKCPVR